MKKLLHNPLILTHVIILISISCSHVNDEIRYKEMSPQQIMEERTESEQKIAPHLFYQIIQYKKNIASGKSEEESLFTLKQNNKYKDDRFCIIARLNTKDKIIGEELKKQLISKDCNVTKVYNGHNDFVELQIWTKINSIAEIAKLKEVAVIETPVPFGFR